MLHIQNDLKELLCTHIYDLSSTHGMRRNIRRKGACRCGTRLDACTHCSACGVTRHAWQCQFVTYGQCCFLMHIPANYVALNREGMKRCIVTGGNQGKRPFPTRCPPRRIQHRQSPRYRIPVLFPNAHAQFTCAGMGLDFAKHLASLGW